MIKQKDLETIQLPFDITNLNGKKLTIIEFSNNDLLGVGGGIFSDIPTAYFKGGGWVLVEDLKRFFTLV